jgi:hypothetical protein
VTTRSSRLSSSASKGGGGLTKVGIYSSCTSKTPSGKVLADEVSDARLFEIADRLRLLASRLAIDLEEAETTATRVDAARAHRRERATRLRQSSTRLGIELEERLAEDAAGLVIGLRLSQDAVTRYRLKRLTEAQRALAVIDDYERALLKLEVADDRALEATAHGFVTRVRALGRAPALRRQLQRDENTILAALPVDSVAAARVRRSVVRTRSAETFARRVDVDAA